MGLPYLFLDTIDKILLIFSFFLNGKVDSIISTSGTMTILYNPSTIYIINVTASVAFLHFLETMNFHRLTCAFDFVEAHLCYSISDTFSSTIAVVGTNVYFLVAPCLIQTPPFFTWLLHPSCLQSLTLAPCLLHTPPIRA